MNYLWTTITVKDLDESLAFYQEIVGLPLNARFQAGPETEIAFLGDGETKIELIAYKGKDAAPAGKGISLGFSVASLEEKISFLEEKGIGIDGEIISPNPHARFFFIQDPNGLRIQFVEQK